VFSQKHNYNANSWGAFNCLTSHARSRMPLRIDKNDYKGMQKCSKKQVMIRYLVGEEYFRKPHCFAF
jgi:hypothetical protein